MSNGEGTISALMGKISLRNLIFCAASLSFIVIIYLKWGEVLSIREVFLKSNISWLLVAISLQVVTYHFFALNYHYIFRIKGHEVSVWELYPMAIITKFLNQAFPSAGISGQIFLIDYLKRRGATVVDGISRAILEITSLFSAFGLLFIFASVLFFTTGTYRVYPQFIYLMYLFWIFAVVALWIFFSFQRGDEGGLIKKFLSYVKNNDDAGTNKKKKPGRLKNYWNIFTGQMKESLDLKFLQSRSNDRLFLMAMLWQFLVLFFNILTLYALAFALNIQISFAMIFIAFTFTQFISMISFVPGSLIIYEGSMTLMLIAFGVSAGSAFTLALLFRALIFWLPMPIGWLLYHQHEKTHHHKAVI